MADTNELPKPGRVAVIGAGVIGTSVAFAFAASGLAVLLIDRPDKDWGPVQRRLRDHQRLARFTSPTRSRVDLQTIVTSTTLADVEGASLIVENVDEVWEVKRDVYRGLAKLRLSGTAVAANTSAFPIARLAELLPDPSAVIGVHFMNPTDRIATVEVVRGPSTSPATVEATLAFLARIGKAGIVVNDAAGFVINRILMVMVNQAAQLVEEGVAEAWQIDDLFKGCLGHRMGPLRTADLIGIDTIVNTLRVLREARDDAMFEPAALLLKMVQLEHLGMKTGRGFYRYDDEGQNA